MFNPSAYLGSELLQLSGHDFARTGFHPLESTPFERNLPAQLSVPHQHAFVSVRVARVANDTLLLSMVKVWGADHIGYVGRRHGERMHDSTRHIGTNARLQLIESPGLVQNE